MFDRANVSGCLRSVSRWKLARIVSAEQVLENREIPDAQAVGALPEAEQRSVVLAIMRRELGVMAAAALVVALLALRALLIL